MAYAHAVRGRRRRTHNPLAAPVAVFVAAIALADIGEDRTVSRL